jgi:hypothetical protein
MINVFKVLVGKLEGKRPFGRSGHRWEDKVDVLDGCSSARPQLVLEIGPSRRVAMTSNNIEIIFCSM